jgi:hypothetical protein
LHTRNKDCPVEVAPLTVPATTVVKASPGAWIIKPEVIRFIYRSRTIAEETLMRSGTIDPVSTNDVTEGEEQNALKIHFESKDSKLEYLDIPVHICKALLSAAYDRVADPDITTVIN